MCVSLLLCVCMCVSLCGLPVGSTENTHTHTYFCAPPYVKTLSSIQLWGPECVWRRLL